MYTMLNPLCITAYILTFARVRTFFFFLDKGLQSNKTENDNILKKKKKVESKTMKKIYK